MEGERGEVGALGRALAVVAGGHGFVRSAEVGRGLGDGGLGRFHASHGGSLEGLRGEGKGGAVAESARDGYFRF